MNDRQNYRITLDNIENKVFFIDHCNHLIKSYFEQNLKDCIVDDDEVTLTHNGLEYDIIRLYEEGVILQRDIRIYKLVLRN
jgi:hypothetical protein